MPAVLSPRQERFCVEWFKLGTKSRLAYLAAGYTAANRNVADACASRLIRSAKIQGRIKEIAAMVLNRAVDVTADTIVTELEEARQLALKCEQGAAAVSATVAKAKLTGLMIERRESGKPGDFEGWTQEELAHFVATGQEPGAQEQVPDTGETELPEPTNIGSNSRQ